MLQFILEMKAERIIFSFWLILFKITVAGLSTSKERRWIKDTNLRKDYKIVIDNILQNQHDKQNPVYSKWFLPPPSNFELLSDFQEINRENRKNKYMQSHFESEGMDIIKNVKNESLPSDEVLKLENIPFGKALHSTALDQIISGKLITNEVENVLPIFLSEPQNGFVLKNRPAVLKCKAAHALLLQFKCSGSVQPPPSIHDKYVDPQTGVHVEEVTATVHRDLVDEFFGKGPFKCECHAWSSRGVVKSQTATINIAYIRKNFVASPTSLKVELGSRAELFCKPPNGSPEPKIIWHKNDVAIIANKTADHTLVPKETLVFQKISLQDMANYTCSAENIAGKRISDAAVVIVYVNGGWSNWSSWKECKCSENQSQGSKRVRTCNNPAPINGGVECLGPQIQKSPDCLTCQDWHWSPWNDWSICSTQCLQERHRKCISDISENKAFTNASNSLATEHSKFVCVGKDIQSAECRGGNCKKSQEYFDWIVTSGMFLVFIACCAFGSAFVCWTRRKIDSTSHYNMGEIVIDLDYACTINKKELDAHSETDRNNYEYASLRQTTDLLDNLITCDRSHHHYDVPNLSTNYSKPSDELSTNALSETADNSTTDASMATSENICGYTSTPTKTYEFVNDIGGFLELYNGDIILYFPDLAINNKKKRMVSMEILNDDAISLCISSSTEIVICSNTVQCTPQNLAFDKPVILKMPHCLFNIPSWKVGLFYAEINQDNWNTNLQRIIIGEEPINTPAIVNMTSTHVFIMTETLGRFVVVAEKLICASMSQPSVRMKLFAFNQIAPNNTSCSLRIYIVKDLPNSKFLCSCIESRLGGAYMGESKNFTFCIDNSDLFIRVHYIYDVYEHVIPFNHFLSSNSNLHCEFNIKLQNSYHSTLTFKVEFYQDSELRDKEIHTFLVTDHYQNKTLNSFDKLKEIYVSQQDNNVCKHKFFENVQWTRTLKQNLCANLDQLRPDERDWRMFAKKLKTDRYMAFFATKASPTEQILNLWECQSIYSTHTVMELFAVLKEMERLDLIEMISVKTAPTWI